MTSLSERAIAIYEARGASLVERYETADSAHVLAPITEVLPVPPVRILDAGAGTGRDAAWLTSLGHVVTAAEPTATFRAVGEERHGEGITWCDARLPALDGLDPESFDAILINGVWHHLSEVERDAAIPRLAALLVDGGRLMMSLRHGRSHPDLPVVPLDGDAEIARARASGLEPILRREAHSHGEANIAAGVTWTWLAFEKMHPHAKGDRP